MESQSSSTSSERAKNAQTDSRPPQQSSSPAGNDLLTAFNGIALQRITPDEQCLLRISGLTLGPDQNREESLPSTLSRQEAPSQDPSLSSPSPAPESIPPTVCSPLAPSPSASAQTRQKVKLRVQEVQTEVSWSTALQMTGQWGRNTNDFKLIIRLSLSQSPESPLAPLDINVREEKGARELTLQKDHWFIVELSKILASDGMMCFVWDSPVQELEFRSNGKYEKIEGRTDANVIPKAFPFLLTYRNAKQVLDGLFKCWSQYVRARYGFELREGGLFDVARCSYAIENASA
jgi:hypothetical protein